MSILVVGVCKICNNGSQVRLVSRAKGICLPHYREEEIVKARAKANDKKDKKGYSGINSVSEKQKEIDKQDEAFYRKIWKVRKHISEVGGDVLPEKFTRWFMSHILCKKLYPKYRHNPDNILLMTKVEHTIWEFGTPKGDKWEKVKQLQENLRDEYNRKEREDPW